MIFTLFIFEKIAEKWVDYVSKFSCLIQLVALKDSGLDINIFVSRGRGVPGTLKDDLVHKPHVLKMATKGGMGLRYCNLRTICLCAGIGQSMDNFKICYRLE